MARAATPRDPSGAPEKLEGQIERVTFYNEENGFAVLRVKAKGHRDLVTLVGPVASANAGEFVEASGRWTVDRTHGPQFSAERIESHPPTSREGIERFLASGLIRGVGPHYAKRLVARFGERVFDIIERESARLEEVEGIGAGRRRTIKQAWEAQKAIRDIMVFLHAHGVSTSRAVRIHRTYGDEAIAKVTGNPYLLARDIHGVGFKTADQIAKQLGIPHDSPLRACGGLEHMLHEQTGAGHCALPRETLVRETAKLLDIGEDRTADALGQLLGRGELAEEPIGGEDLIFLPPMQAAEKGVARLLRALSGARPPYPPIDPERAVAWWEGKSGKTLAAGQRDAIRAALENRLLVVTGGPGVGKTTLLNALLAILRAKRVRPALCAPTGRAAKRLAEATGIEARTIHRMLEFQPGRGGFARNERNPLDHDLLVVDECSMVDVPLMHGLLRAHPPRAALLLVGDADQLPSVGPGSLLAHLIESRICPVVRLTEIFRQAAASRIIAAAHAINAGRMPDLDAADPGADFHFFPREEPGAIASTVISLVAGRISKKTGLPHRDIQVLCPMHRGPLGTREINAALQRELNPPRHDQPGVERFGWEFRPGDRVLQTENNYDKDVFNGDIGEITRVLHEERELRVRIDDREVAYGFDELDELQPAYAISVHKSQGSEFPAIVIPVSTQHFMMLQRNLIYTAITRGKRLVVAVGQKKALAMAINNAHTTRRISGLLERLRA